MRAHVHIYTAGKMKTTAIKVADYYGVATYYSVMPRAIFDALEASALKGEEFVEVDSALLDEMHKAYTQKMKRS